MLTRPLITSALAGALVLAAAGGAHADGKPGVSAKDCDLMSFCVGVATPGRSGAGHQGPHSSGRAAQDSKAAPPADCSVRKMDPQPPPGSKYYRDGNAVYEQVCAVPGQGGLVDVKFLGAAAGGDAPAVDPAVLAQQALDKMDLEGPAIASPRPGGTYTVGVPMWLWVNQSATTYGPNTASASAGGITVTATAKVSKIVWAMGDGSAVTCTGPGTPYRAAAGMSESPTCGHVYAKSAAGAGGKFQVTATSTWTIDWQGGGQNGQLTETRQTGTQAAVGELQVVR
ncbi:ATP/GTP-binding protein [Streptomyces sp. NPDC004286]|uniref:ATP/GTP-binding protein n=1 Tax=Streptomyces sp. NPDC004286 TaxID=3364696 RepID=UPI0036BE5F9E